MDFDRQCAEIVTQTTLLTVAVAGADLRAPVPSCPGWTLGMLLRHIGGGHHWAEEIVRTGKEGAFDADELRILEGDDTGDAPIGWLLEGAHLLSETLRTVGPDPQVWAPFEYDTAKFWARRFTNETAVHRADACLAAGVGYDVSQDVALDIVDEWFELDANPVHFEITPRKRELLGAGRTLAFETPAASWFLDLTGDVIRWRRGTGDAAVTVRLPLTDFVLALYQRTPVPAEAVHGDAGLLETWRSHVAFG